MQNNTKKKDFFNSYFKSARGAYYAEYGTSNHGQDADIYPDAERFDASLLERRTAPRPLKRGLPRWGGRGFLRRSLLNHD